MVKWIILIMMMMLLTTSALAWKDSFTLNEEIIIEDIIESYGEGAWCNITIYQNNTLIDTDYMARTGLAYSHNITNLNLTVDYYGCNIECNLSNSTFLNECNFTIETGDNMILAALIFAPLILGLMFMLGSFFLGPEHNVLKIALFILAPVTFWVSLHFGTIALIELYNMPELINSIGFITKVTGAVFFVILAYFLIYAFYKAIHIAAQDKKERLEY